MTPLWGRPRRELLSNLLESGFKAVFSLVKKPWFTEEWVGRALDQRAVDDLERLALETDLDLCGENGEYHTLVLDGPIFKKTLVISASTVGIRAEAMFLKIHGITEKRPVTPNVR